MMRKTITLTTAAMLAAITISTPTPADARGGRIAAGVIGGLAAGAIIGGALASPYYYGGGCYWRRVWPPFGLRHERVCY